MQTFSSTVRCAVCKRVLSRATGIPQADCAQAAEAATHVLACPERGHMRNSLLIFGWDPEHWIVPEAPNAPNANAPAPAVPGVEPPVTARHDPPILSEDELSALIAEHEGRVSQDEIKDEGGEAGDGPITLNGGSPDPDPNDTADLAARVLSGEI